MNPIIEVDGGDATGEWLLFQPCTIPGDLVFVPHNLERAVDPSSGEP